MGGSEGGPGEGWDLGEGIRGAKKRKGKFLFGRGEVRGKGNGGKSNSSHKGCAKGR